MFAALALRGRTAPYYRGQALYRVFLIAMGLASYAALALWLRFSTSGLYARAVNQDPSVARMMGVDADRLSLLLISLSAAFAGVAGVLAGPYLSVDPGMDVSMIVNCLIIVVIDGTRSIAGAIVAALLFGFVLVAGSVLLPDLAALAPYVLLFALLLIAPRQSARLHDADPRCRRDDQQWLG
jgi:branched-chain amino acid transport system permease protein